MEVSIQDDFLSEENFNALRDLISSTDYPWFYHAKLDYEDYDEGPPEPGFFCHVAYQDNSPNSSFYKSHFLPILQALDVALLLRIKVNLNPRLPEAYSGMFHVDNNSFPEHIVAKCLASIFYINTCNGYTELKDGTKIESVANRVVSFPLNTEHRTVTQTDEQTRLLINFNYIRRSMLYLEKETFANVPASSYHPHDEKRKK